MAAAQPVAAVDRVEEDVERGERRPGRTRLHLELRQLDLIRRGPRHPRVVANPEQLPLPEVPTDRGLIRKEKAHFEILVLAGHAPREQVDRPAA